MSEALEALMRIDAVSVRFGGILALDEVTFEIERGRITGLIGPNGAGKSTLFNCISRLYDCTAGSIHFDGLELSTEPRHRVAGLGVGRTFQNLALFRSMTVRENVMVGCHSRQQPGFLRAAFRTRSAAQTELAIHRRADEMIEFLGLSAVAGRRVADLPFGTQKRVELARALASQPKLLLLDEPACGLNHEEVSSLGEMIVDIQERLGVTILLVEHHMSLVMGVSDKVVALNFGKKIAEGAPAEVRSHPEVVRAYLGTKH